MTSDSAFARQLSEWGPAALPLRAVPYRVDAARYCAALAGSHYENFTVVSRFLPRAVRQPFANIYAYCRWADDLGDEVGDPVRSRELLDWWREELRACYAGRLRHPVFVALRETIDEFAIPIEPFDQLLSAFEQDQRVTEYETFDQLRDYCRRSADPVGRLVLFLCRQHREELLDWSDSICSGLQLANFWQDVDRDLRIGRIYLPREDCDRFGYSRDDLRNRLTTPAFIQLMEFEVTRARQYLEAGLPLIPRLPGRFQIAIDLFARGGLRILQKISAQNYRVWDRRPKVTKWDAASLMLGATTRHLGRWIGIGR